MKRYQYTNGQRNFKLVDRKWDEFHGITLACITMDEERDIVEFLNHIKPFVKRIVLVDGGSFDKTVERARPLVDTISIIPFTGHYGNQKNNAIELSFTDWTLFMDPDERLPVELLKKLPDMINQDEFDCYSFPRREFLSGVENKTPYPDYQDRLFRTYCRYVRPIHHELVGYKNKCVLPMDSGMDIHHIKESDRHSARNKGHRSFEVHLKHELGAPGSQIEETMNIRYPFLNIEGLLRQQ